MTPVRKLGQITVAIAALTLGLVATGCGAKTGLEVPDAGDASMIPCIEIPPDGGPIELPLDTEVQVGRADVVFAIDTTASMNQEIERIANELRSDIVPAIDDRIQDSQLGVTTFADFADVAGNCGLLLDNDVPFRLLVASTDDLDRVQSALDGIGINNGSDPPESQVEALYQLATGEGVPGFVPASFGCPGGGFGYPCFRNDALPIVLLFTDARFHNGPMGMEPYSEECPDVAPFAHSYEEARDALLANGIRVIGLFSGDPSERGGFEALQTLARDTGAVGTAGEPLVFDIGQNGERLSESVVNAITTLTDVLRFDIDTVLVDPDPTDDFDPRTLVASVDPLRAEPMEDIEGIDFDRHAFLGVLTGTRVIFQMTLRNDVLPPGPLPRRFLLEVVFRGDMSTRIGSTLIEIVVGPDGTCEMN